MSSIISSLPVVYTAHVPLCDKNFQCIRIAIDSISKVCLVLFYKVISLAFRIVNTKISHHYDSLSKFEWAKIKFSIYLKHTSEIVDFSINSFTRVKEFLPNTMTELEGLKSIYGPNSIERWSRLTSDDLQINELSRKEIVKDGCCFGMCLDFISSYLQQIKSGKTALQAIKAIAHTYAHGAPDKAQLAQIFYDASGSKAQMQRCQLIDKIRKEMKIWLDLEEIRIKSLPPEEIQKNLQILKVQAPLKSSELFLRLENDAARGEAALHNQKIASGFSLVQGQPIVYRIDGNLRRPLKNSEFEAFISQLPQGIYDIGLKDHASKIGHAIVFIKTGEGKHFIYDPNDATLAVNPKDSSARLWEIVRQYMTKDNFTLLFTPYAMPSIT